MIKDDIKVALIGFGYWGINLARVFSELGVLDTICDSDLNRIKQIKKEYPKINAKLSFKYILENQYINAVAISTPPSSHYELVKEALLSGKDVFVEKPLALTFEDGKELVELAEKNKRVLMIGHILEYHPAVNKLKELIDKGNLGRIHYIYSNRLNLGRFRKEENILWSFAPHDISTILMLLGEEPIKVTAFGGEYLNAGICDTTLTTMEFKNGIKGHIFVSWLHPYKEQRLVVVGSAGMAVFDDLSEEKLIIYPHHVEWKDGKIPSVYKAERTVAEIEKKEPLGEELKHFIQCLKSGKRPKTDGNEALRVLKVLESAEQFLRGKHI